MFPSLWNWLTPTKTIRRTNPGRHKRHPLRLEWLEDRVVPAVPIAHPDYVLLTGVKPFAGSGPTGYTPAQIEQAYGTNLITFNNGTVAGNGSGTTIAIVDAYKDPNVVSDLHQFDLQYGLPDPTMTVENQTGGTKLPAGDTGWAEETALDVEWAHAIAPAAGILLVEANSASYTDLFTAVHTAAATPGVVAVSMSWGGGETSNEATYDSYFTTPSGHAGVTFLASSGDAGAPPSYPSVSPNVVSVGGTTLSLDASGNILSESGWDSSGGGVSAYESQPGYQAGVVTQTSTARANPDVAYDADPNTGFSEYNSYSFPTAPWQQLGGTSDAAPQWAALVAIADQGRALAGLGSLDGPSQTLSMIYKMSAVDFHDITTGTSTGTPSYSAGPGYDLVTGRGTPVANLVVSYLVASSLPADMAVTAGGPSSVTAGTDATYTVTITNNGPNAAQGVVLNDTFPAGALFVSMTQTSGTDTFAFGQSGGSASASATGNMASGSSDTFTVVVFAPYHLSNGASFNDTASVSAGNPDPNPANNSATVSGSVVVLPPPAQLQDPGFETPSVGSGASAYQYDPAASPWAFVGQAGVSGNGSGFTSGNPSAPQGSQVAFLQNAGSFSQAVTLSGGTYAVSFSAAQRATYQSSSQTFEVLLDGLVVGTFTPSGISYATLTTSVFALAAGVHTVAFVGLNPKGGDNTAFIDQATISAAPPPPAQFQDPGFETPAVGTGAYQYDPAASPWAFVGQAGVSGNGSGFTSGNPSAPQGSQVAFLQNAGSFSQEVTLTAGTYAITFSAAQRATYQSSSQTFEVLLDGAAVATFTPSGTTYATYTTGVFAVTDGIHTVAFVGLNPKGGDNTAFVDQVALASAPQPPAQLQDPGFETPSVGSGGSAYQYDPAASPWTFVGQAGVSGNGSGFTSGNPNAPQGSQVAFLQNVGSFSQQVTLSAGAYVITFSAAQRALYQSSSQTFNVLIDGVAMRTFAPSGSSYATYTTGAFTVTAGIHTIAFVGLNPNGGDNTALIDQVTLSSATPPTQLQDPGFETPAVGAGAYQYDPLASPWSFVGQAGVSGNGSGFTSGNPGAPQGSQVAFLQNVGSFSQTVTLSAGIYSVSFSAAQRALYQSSSQTFQVRVDGVAVGTFTPSGSSYTTYVASFTVAAGAHTIAFVGLNPNGGDNTAFIDQVALSSAQLAGAISGPRVGSRISGHTGSHGQRSEAPGFVPDLGWWTGSDGPTGRLRRGNRLGETGGDPTS